MALQILNPQRSFGEELGQSLSSGLSKLAESKLQQMHFADALKRNNYSDSQIDLLNQLPTKDRLEALQSLSPGGRQQSSQQQSQIALPQDSQLSQLAERVQNLGQKPEGLTQQELMQEYNQTKMQDLGLNSSKGPSADLQTLLGEAARQGMNITDEQKQKMARKIQDIYNDKNKRQALEQDVMKYVAEQQGKQQQAQPTAPASPTPSIQQALESQSLFKKPLTTQQQLKAQEASEKHQEAKEKRAQDQIEKQNKPFNQRLEKALPTAERAVEIAEEMKGLLEGGKVAYGIGGTLLDLPYVRTFLNPESQIFAARGNDLAETLAQQGGVASKYRIEVRQSAKPNLGLKPEAQVAGVEKVLFDGLKTLEQAKIRNELIEANGKEPDNLEIKVQKELAKRIPQLKKQSKVNYKGHATRPGSGFLGIGPDLPESFTGY